MMGLLLRILLRESMVGCCLYLLVGGNARLNLVACVVVFSALLAFTNRHGLLRHRTKADIINESLVVFVGGMAVRNLLRLTAGILGWS